MIRQFLTSNDDWIEQFRRTWYPRFHPKLTAVGGLIGVPLYATGAVKWNQYVGGLSESEDAIEEELGDLTSIRNPIAALKELPDGRTSEGSWVILHDDAPNIVPEGMQLHLTLFVRDSDKPGRAVYAHLEDDWRVNPLAHLRAKNFSAKQGVQAAEQLFNDSSFLTLKDSK